MSSAVSGHSANDKCFRTSGSAARYTLYPDIVRCGKRAAGPAGVDDASGFDKQRVAFTRRAGDVLDSFGDHEHLARADNNDTVPKTDFHFTFEHQEHLVRVLVIVPYELSLQLDELELAVVHFGHHTRRPMLREFR